MNEIGEAWDDVWAFLHRHSYLEAVVIVVLFYVLARLVDWLLSGSLRRLVLRSETDFDDKLVEILHRPIKATVLMIGLITATYRLDLTRDVERNIVLVITTLLIIVWTSFGRRLSRLALGAMKDRKGGTSFVQPATEPLLSNAAAVVFFIVAAYAILLVWDINITGLVASAGIIGLALSFAAQDTLSNLFAGIAIMSDRPYQIGDFINLDSGERGKVIRIGLRSTSLLTRDDVEVSIPNGVMGASKIVNEAGGPPLRYRIRTRVTVAYGSDIDLVSKVLYAVADEHEKTLPYPEPRVRFRKFGDSGLEYEVLCWIKRPADRGRILHELNSEIYHRFADSKIRIPPPQRDLYIRQVPGSREPPLPGA
jgi:small-conductance mechanosensitive channel